MNVFDGHNTVALRFSSGEQLICGGLPTHLQHRISVKVVCLGQSRRGVGLAVDKEQRMRKGPWWAVDRPVYCNTKVVRWNEKCRDPN